MVGGSCVTSTAPGPTTSTGTRTRAAHDRVDGERGAHPAHHSYVPREVTEIEDGKVEDETTDMAKTSFRFVRQGRGTLNRHASTAHVNPPLNVG